MPLLNVDESAVPYFKRMREICEWIDSFSISGDGVTVVKNGRGIAIRIAQPRSSVQGGGIQDIRYNGDTHYLQTTNALAPGESSWVDKIQFVSCESSSVSAAVEAESAISYRMSLAQAPAVR